MTPREAAIAATLIGLVVWLGLFPQTVLDTGRRALENLRQSTAATRSHGGGGRTS